LEDINNSNLGLMEHTRGCGSPNKILQKRLLLSHESHTLKRGQNTNASALTHGNVLQNFN
jgi:hypothetical protein